MIEGRGSILAQKCLQEVRNGKKRKQLFEDSRREIGELEGKRVEGEARYEELEERDRKRQREKR